MNNGSEIFLKILSFIYIMLIIVKISLYVISFSVINWTAQSFRFSFVQHLCLWLRFDKKKTWCLITTDFFLYQGARFWNIKYVQKKKKKRFQHSEAYSELCQTSKMKFVKALNSFVVLTLHLRSLLWFWICQWYHYVSYYYVAIFTVNGSLWLLHLFCFAPCQRFI